MKEKFCDICNQRCVNKSNLNRHMKNKHSNKSSNDVVDNVKSDESISVCNTYDISVSNGERFNDSPISQRLNDLPICEEESYSPKRRKKSLKKLSNYKVEEVLKNLIWK